MLKSNSFSQFTFNVDPVLQFQVQELFGEFEARRARQFTNQSIECATYLNLWPGLEFTMRTCT